MRPRDTLRLAHRIDVDAETGMALAMATAGPEGQMLERYEYATIDYAEPAPDSGHYEHFLIGPSPRGGLQKRGNKKI